MALTCKIPNAVGSVRARRNLRRATSDGSEASPTEFPVLAPLLQPMGGSNVKPLEPAPGKAAAATGV